MMSTWFKADHRRTCFEPKQSDRDHGCWLFLKCTDDRLPACTLCPGFVSGCNGEHDGDVWFDDGQSHDLKSGAVPRVPDPSTKNNEAKQSLLKLNSQSKSTFKKSGGSNTNGNNSCNSKPNSGSSGRSNNFNGSAGSVASGSHTSKSANGSNNRFQKNKK
ncbi:hypothetical protein ACTFIV_003154 [Dictyostelium citrinum]